MTALTYISLVLFSLGAGKAQPVSDVTASFENVPRTFSQVPFWFWNGPLDPNQFRLQLRQMASKGVYGAMPHPRFGMDRRQYLQPPYWRAMAATIDEAEKLGMQIWLYDEYNWPSGGAGGRVTDGHPELYPRGLDYCIRDVDDGPAVISIARPEPSEPRMERFEKIIRGFIKRKDAPAASCQPWGKISSDGFSIGGSVPEGQWNVLVFFQCLGHNPSPLDDGSNSMTDYLSAEPAKRFLALTHEEYYRRFSKYFGNTIPAVFTDESSTTSPSPFPWTELFAMKFQAHHGTDILDSLPLLLDPDSEEGSKVRMAYWQTVADLFKEGFIEHEGSWCREHGVKFIGHIYEENIRSYAHAAQLMSILRSMDMPGFDALGPRCPAYGAKPAISVAHLEDKQEALCECLGLAGGWNCTMDMLRTGYNGLGVLGVSRFVPHAFFQTLDNPRVECPPCFFYNNPYWKYYKKIADLSARLSYFNHLGRHAAPVLVYYPIESLWADSVGGKGRNVLPWQHRTEGNSDASRTCKVFNDIVDGLFSRRWDLDVADDELLAGSSVKIEGGSAKLCIGPEEFRILIIPPVTAIGARTIEAIDRFLRQGGEVVWLERFARFTWPLSPTEPQQTLRRWFDSHTPRDGEIVRVGKGRIAFLHGDPEKVCEYLDRETGPEITVSEGLTSLRVTHRKTEDADYFLLFNDSDEFIAGDAHLPASGEPILVDMDTGKAYSGTAGKRGLQIRLRPHQSMCAIYSSGKTNLPVWSCDRPEGKKLDLSEGWTIQLIGSELDDKWESSVGATSIQLPVFHMKKREFNNIPRWTETDYSDEEWERIHTLRDSGLFTDASTILLRTVLPPGAAALETPLPVTGEYAIWVNGQLVEKNLGPQTAQKGQIVLKNLVAGGRNVLAIETISHYGPAGLSRPIDLVCKPGRIERLRSWRELGFGFYSGRVLYRKQIRIDDEFNRAWLDLGKVEHYVEVFINGQLVDTLLWPPYEIEITDYLNKGQNELVLVVANSIANRFAWDVWGTRGSAKAEASGIIGPAYLWVKK